MSVMGSTTITPRLGAIVRYTLSEANVRDIIHQRRAAGLAIRNGNDPREGDTYPAMIVRDWGADAETRARYIAGEVTRGNEVVTVITLDEAIQSWAVNLQVFLDGNDTFWVTSVTRFNPSEHGRHNLPADVAGPNDIGAAEADYSKFWEPDPRGHWTDEPVSW